jgi:hypothetical protein
MFYSEEEKRYRKCGEALKEFKYPEEIKEQETIRLVKKYKKEKGASNEENNTR